MVEEGAARPEPGERLVEGVDITKSPVLPRRTGLFTFVFTVGQTALHHSLIDVAEFPVVLTHGLHNGMSGLLEMAGSVSVL